MDSLTQSRRLTPEEQAKFQADRRRKNFERISKNLDAIAEFIEDVEDVIEELENAGIDVSRAKDFVERISRPVNRLKTLKDFTQDAITSAEEVQLQLSQWYNQAEAKCRALKTDDVDMAETICSAELTRQWQGRNVKYVLGAQADSWAMRLWDKWRARIFDMLPI